MYTLETNHNNSQYQYPLTEPWEMPDGPKGSPVAWTGMVWDGFRPSDDPHRYGYNIPVNLMLASYLDFVQQISQDIFMDYHLSSEAGALRESILRGVEQYGTTRFNEDRIYCYEVDGLGGCNVMDDANPPSLLSIPYFDPRATTFDMNIYANTRNFILSPKNPWFSQGEREVRDKLNMRGIGSPRTGEERIWPMSLVMQALTTGNIDEQAYLFETLLRTAKDGFLHESFHRDAWEDVTEDWFAPQHAMFAELVHETTGRTCGTMKDAPEMPQPKERSSDSLPSGAKVYPGALENSAKLDFYTADPTTLRHRTIPGLDLLMASDLKAL